MKKRNSTLNNWKSLMTISLTAFIGVFSSQAGMARCTNETALGVMTVNDSSAQDCSSTSDFSTATVECTTYQAAPPCIGSPTYPANGAGNICNPTIALSWPASPGATEYDLYFGTTNPPVYYATTTNTSYTVNNISISTYYWVIRPRNNTGVAAGCNIWTFDVIDCTPPCVASPIYPANGAANICSPTILTWPTSPGATNYDLYFGTTNPPMFYASTPNTSYSVNNISLGTNYWRIRPSNSSGTASGCNVWSFDVIDCAPPCIASPISPANGQTGLCPSPTTILSWPASPGATSYQVYFGTTNPPQITFTNLTTSVNLSVSTTTGTFFWQVRPMGPGGTALGCNIWSYTRMDGAFVLPPNGATQVACPAAIVQLPPPPTVVTNCGSPVTITGLTSINSPNPITCEGTRTYTWTYDNNLGQTSTWSYVITVERQPFSLPPNGAAQVNCQANAIQPVPPVVLSNCGESITPTGPIITNTPNPITCGGTRTFAWNYTDCEGNTATWSFVFTIVRQPFSVPANGGSTVACPDQTDTQPTPPVVTSNCGEILTPVITSTAKPGCEGNRNWNFAYTDCQGNTATWTYIYTVEYLDFAIPASETVTVNCPLNASQPTPPIVKDNCNKMLTPTGPVITTTTLATGCEGSRKYAWTYQDCEGNTHTWSKTFNFTYPGGFFVYPDGEDFVSCLLYAQPPIPPTIYGTCGEELQVLGPTVTGSDDGCSGTKKYAYTYVDCGGYSLDWSFTYHANDNEPPVGTIPNVDVTNLACTGDVPCPGDYDFSAKTAELLDKGNFYDVCGGDDITVELDSWSALWECTASGTAGQYTFGRTFYFSISDACGNVYPELCSVTYSGTCLPLETFPQGAWGNAGGEPGTDVSANTTDTQVITNLLNNNPLTVGGASRSLTLTDAGCVVSLLPGIGNPTVLTNCQQVNCIGCNPAGPIGMKNKLAANTVALVLNMRYNVQYNGLTMAQVRNQRLDCVDIDPNIKSCVEGGGGKLRIFESNGTVHEFPYTVGGLLDLTNLYLNGGLALSPGAKLVYASAINNSVSNVNDFWHNGQGPANCDPAAGASATADNGSAKTLPGKPGLSGKAFSLAPNPASREVIFKLAEMAEAQEVTLDIYNQLGQLVMHQDFGKLSYVNERIDLSGIGSGLYIVSVRAGGQRYEQKLVVSKD